MSQPFAPGLHRAGETGRMEAYTGTRRSVEEIAQAARHARHDADLRGWAVDALARAGIDSRARTATRREKVQCLLDALRAVTIYVPDPAGSEWIQKPHVTLCLRNLCIRGGDCDDLLLCLVGLCLTVGIPVFLVKQEFGVGAQEHILMGFYDEVGMKLYADPANTTAPVYSGSRASREYWVDPLDQVGETGRVSPDFVTLGAVSEGTKCPGCKTVSTATMQRAQMNPQLQPHVGLGITSFGDLDSLDAQIQAQVTALDAAIAACPTMPQADTASWPGFKAAWQNEHQQWVAFKTTMGTLVALPMTTVPAAIATVLTTQFSSFDSDFRAFAAQLPTWWGKVKAACPSTVVPAGVVLPNQPGTPGERTARDFGDAVAVAAKAVGALAVTGLVVYAGFEAVKVAGPWLSRRRAT